MLNIGENQPDLKSAKSSSERNRILFVDDEQNVLDGIRRQLRRQFNIDVALGAEEGLRRLELDSSYAVVVSDMRMPGMDGIHFLNRVKQISPNIIRMMLTGNSDQQTASDAVNKGSIFRFMNKPCSVETLVSNLEAAFRQFELINAEKELLEKTLKGSIEVLVDILALTNPEAFSRAERIKYYVSNSVQKMGRDDVWKFEVASMLSQIGYVTIPPDIMEKSFAGEELTPAEQAMIAGHSNVASQMIDKIPRLEEIGQMIALKDSVGSEDAAENAVILGAQLLRAVIEFDQLLLRGARPYQALHQMRESTTPFSTAIMKLLEDIQPPVIEKTVKRILISNLRVGMTLAEDIRSTSHALIVSKGQVVSALMHRRLENFRQQNAISDTIRVYEARQMFIG